MKTQIILLDQSDDQLSIRDKLNWSQAGRILLVWPQHAAKLIRRLDLTLINRHAIALGVQLALVTQDRRARFIADQLGIPVFINQRLALLGPWNSIRSAATHPQPKYSAADLVRIRKEIHPAAPAWMGHPLMRFFCLVISLLAIIALGVFILPGAKVVVTPKKVTQSLKFEVIADPNLLSISSSNANLPTYAQEVLVDGTDTIATTGSMLFPDQFAEASLKFTNTYTHTVNIPPGTTVASKDSDPVRFITQSKDFVPVDPYKSVLVPARALKPGATGNLAAKKLVTVEGELGQYLAVANPNKASGGTDTMVPAPIAQDLETLRKNLVDQLENSALDQLHSIILEADTLITPTLSLVDTIEEKSIPFVGEPGNTLKLSLHLRFEIKVVSEAMLVRFLSPNLASYTPTGYSAIPNTLVISQLSQPQPAADENYHWIVSVVRNLQADISAQQVVGLITGATPTQAKDKLSASLPLQAPVQITMAPGWWPRLPYLPMRIISAQAETP